jgi:phage portal protein BeeE
MRWPQRHDRDLFQIGSIPVSTTYAAVPVSPTTAMQHSAVWACVNLIAGSISTLPLAAYRIGEERPRDTLPPILRQPSAGWSLPEFLYAVLQCLLIRGNAYGLIVDRAGASCPPRSSCWPLSASASTSPTAWSTGSTANESTRQHRARPRLHDRRQRGRAVAHRPRQAGRGLGLGAEKYAA